MRFDCRRPAAGGWREEGDEAEPMEAEAASHPSGAAPSEQWEDSSVTQERAIGSGAVPAGILTMYGFTSYINTEHTGWPCSFPRKRYGQ